MLQRMNELGPSELAAVAMPLVTVLLPRLLSAEPGTALHMHRMFRTLWFRASAALPRSWYVHTMRAMQASAASRYTHSDLVRDPLSVLRAHPHVFQSPPLFEVLLKILGSYMVAAQAEVDFLVKNAPGRKTAANCTAPPPIIPADSHPRTRRSFLQRTRR